VRILNSDFRGLNFKKLGMPAKIEHNFSQDLLADGRMILVTGPTGSGKTTTLYTALNLLSDGTSNIETVEDPIEYRIPGINQIQIHEAARVTFASCLRSILRQDPDVIMIGEIRDAETANIALQAAQTGHTVISTLHTNDAPSAITRLLNLGCDAFTLSSSLAGILAQRLIRKNCPKCLAVDALEIQNHNNTEIFNRFNIDTSLLRYGIGCEYCRYTGYHGRIGVYSYLHMTPEIGTLIHRGASILEIIKEANKAGFCDLDQAALTFLNSGETSLAEVRSLLLTHQNHELLNLQNSHIANKQETQHAISKSGHRTTIMLVEDDINLRTSVALNLRKEHFRVIEMESGVVALNTIRETSPDIIITGLGLPIIDGRQLLLRIREQRDLDSVPVIILTSADSDENEAELLNLGADDFVSRSRSPEVLIQRVKRALKVHAHNSNNI
jgi:type IV pilus assembly protein PilB